MYRKSVSNPLELPQVLKSRPWFMRIRPLWLREKPFWKIYWKHTNKFIDLFEDASLEFAPKHSLRLMLTDVSHQQIALLGFCELSLSRRMVQLAKMGGLMVDVGANYGYYSCLWATANPKNQVVAFEASPRNLSALQHNLNKNKLETQVEIRQTAVGKESGSLPFTLGPEEQSGWGGLLAVKEEGTVKVTVVPLDEILLKGQDKLINVLKIDTEGADTWVLQGAEQLLRSHKIHHIFFEENITCMSALGIKPGEAQALLQDCGYCIQRLGSGEWYANTGQKPGQS